MTYRIIPLWTVHETTNEFRIWGEYGSLGKLIGYFDSAQAARAAAAAGKGAWGSEGDIKDGHGLVIGSETFVLGTPLPITPNLNLPLEKQKLKEQALAKLTPDEKRALGLKE